MIRLTLLFEDGRSATIEARPTETVYAAALRQKVRLASDCLEGACATCKGLCTEGRFELGDYVEEALSDAERAQGFTLACQMRATSDCVVEFPYPSTQAMAKLAPVEQRGTVRRCETVAADVIRLDIDVAAPFAYLPGQYVKLRVPGGSALRSYSMANAHAGDGRLTFYVKVLAEGAMSAYAKTHARVGDEMGVLGPYGHFYLRPPVRPIVMVAGGTGLAPMLAMLEHMANAASIRQPVHLLYGANHATEFFADDMLASFAGGPNSLQIERIPVAGEGWTGVTGHVTTLLRHALLHGGDIDAYLCGPPPMVEAAHRWLADRGITRIYAEKFLPS
jgi:NAD(P)H-flavin reductase/ferredoxin